MPTTDTWWFTKSRRAQNEDDYETWIEGGVMPTMNAFDNGDIRTTILVGCFELWDFPTESVAPAMTSRRARDLIKYEEPIVFQPHHYDGARVQTDVMNTLTSRIGTGGNNVSMMSNLTGVRRLTPVECERLQGFPDNWTEGQSDSARYKQMGNAVAVPVVEWIIGNICDTLKEAE